MSDAEGGAESNAYLCDVGQTNEIGHEADSGDEQLPPAPELPRELVHQGGDEALHGAELQVESPVKQV